MKTTTSYKIYSPARTLIKMRDYAHQRRISVDQEFHPVSRLAPQKKRILFKSPRGSGVIKSLYWQFSTTTVSLLHSLPETRVGSFHSPPKEQVNRTH